MTDTMRLFLVALAALLGAGWLWLSRSLRRDIEAAARHHRPRL